MLFMPRNRGRNDRLLLRDDGRRRSATARQIVTGGCGLGLNSSAIAREDNFVARLNPLALSHRAGNDVGNRARRFDRSDLHAPDVLAIPHDHQLAIHRRSLPVADVDDNEVPAWVDSLDAPRDPVDGNVITIAPQLGIRSLKLGLLGLGLGREIIHELLFFGQSGLVRGELSLTSARPLRRDLRQDWFPRALATKSAFSLFRSPICLSLSASCPVASSAFFLAATRSSLAVLRLPLLILNRLIRRCQILGRFLELRSLPVERSTRRREVRASLAQVLLHCSHLGFGQETDSGRQKHDNDGND